MQTHQHFSIFGLSCLLVLLSGCIFNAEYESNQSIAESQTVTANNLNQSKSHISDHPEHIQVIRHGRYSLVEVERVLTKKNLLSQIIDIKIPVATQKKATTVADALQYVLLNSGYRLCETPDIKIFDDYSLPLMHYRFGPVTIEDALSILAGEGWKIEIDHFKRMVCFSPTDPSQLISTEAAGHGISDEDVQK